MAAAEGEESSSTQRLQGNAGYLHQALGWRGGTCQLAALVAARPQNFATINLSDKDTQPKLRLLSEVVGVSIEDCLTGRISYLTRKLDSTAARYMLVQERAPELLYDCGGELYLSWVLNANKPHNLRRLGMSQDVFNACVRGWPASAEGRRLLAGLRAGSVAGWPRPPVPGEAQQQQRQEAAQRRQRRSSGGGGSSGGITMSSSSGVGGDVEAALKEADKAVKKQKVCSSSSEAAVDRLLQAVERARARLAAPGASPQAVLAEVAAELAGQGELLKTMTGDTKELHGAVSKLGKIVERSFAQDIARAYKSDRPLDAAALNQVIAEHLFHEGLFDIGRLFVREAGVAGGEALQRPYASMHTVLQERPYASMHTVLQEIQQHNLAPALAWVREHDAALAGPGGEPSAFEFAIHRLAFLALLKEQGQQAAMAYARQHFARFQGTQMRAIQRLMGALCFSRRAAAGRPNPYAELMAEDLWGNLAREFVRQCCVLLGQAQDSPLLVTVAAGAAALPTLLKLAAVMGEQPVAELAGAAEQLPVEIPLGREFVFHSIFACPVSRDQSTHDNPPMLLPCGHCICKASILKIAKAANRTFKCPYCPAECTPKDCQELVFPDMD
ncbi:RMD5-like protein A isoform A [Chlorella sorokiniana]|uniref:RMD5-like protein A isoform A n=1 Tax=Chlorella sorokiniana TaxID=3076 RepID=A0A2P6TNX0_CHLSO|nr:RMD5-like protein A isoform B [Chlorella sorokiniana]PRW51024.1 RMD5-like protein A isoform A [Chlorella sorokiniana]|eukprot:PRW51023.1 RMD5-like protein A isoform B [Chlorella sorokiniana]